MSETTSLNESVARTIRIELARRDLAQQDLAKLGGWTPTQFSRRMSGEIPWSTDELDKVAFILNMSVTELTQPVQRPIPPQPPMTDEMAGRYLGELSKRAQR